MQELKKTNTLLAASARKSHFFTNARVISDNDVVCVAEQDMRDKGLGKITEMLVTEQRWVELEQPTQQKHLRVIWEGLFFSKYSKLAIDSF